MKGWQGKAVAGNIDPVPSKVDNKFLRTEEVGDDPVVGIWWMVEF